MVVGGDRATADALASDLRNLLPDFAAVETVDGVDEAIALGSAVRRRGGVVPVIFAEVGLEDGKGTDGVMTMHRHDSLTFSRMVLTTSRASLHGVDRALQAGAVNGMIARPWTQHGLHRMLDAHLATYLLEYAPDRLDDFASVLDDEARSEAAERIREEHHLRADSPRSVHPLLDHATDDDTIEQQLIDLLDRALGHPPRIRVAPGTIMIEADEDVGGIYVILEGTVRLTSLPSTGEHILHEQSTGSIVGLLSLASHRRAMLRCRAVTDVRAIPITIDQLGRALGAEPELSGLLNRVLIVSLATRLRRSDELQVELEQSLADLSEARAQLVSSARFATLGEISAGMAHELNNPSAALVRAMDHVADDLATALDDPTVKATFSRQLEAPPLSLSTRRALRRDLTAQLGDRTSADRLIDLGFTEEDDLRALAGLDTSTLGRVEAAARLGQTIRNATGASLRIHSLVESLRAYSRGEDGRGPMVPGVDVVEGLDNALRLLTHRTGEVSVERQFADSIPPLTARPGALQQVWTNLISNALDAMNDSGNLIVRARSTRSGHAVRVEVADDGPGVPAELVDRIFEPRFTTKDGQVRFGLGLGLSISRQIVQEHGGIIAVKSRPGDTVFSVELPVAADDEENKLS